MISVHPHENEINVPLHMIKYVHIHTYDKIKCHLYMIYVQQHLIDVYRHFDSLFIHLTKINLHLTDVHLKLTNVHCTSFS